jgi:3-oxoacyl-[acyl-carrier protein] reductase
LCLPSRRTGRARLERSDSALGAGHIRPARADHLASTGGIYAASKSALEMLTKALALESAEAGIRVNAVAPGFAPGSEVSDLPPEHVDKIRRTIPLGRTSGPLDALSAILWLCSSAASFVTGTTLTVDGGRTAGDFTPTPRSS